MDRRSFLAGGAALAATGLPALSAGSAYAAASPTLPSRTSIIASMRLVADHWLSTHTQHHSRFPSRPIEESERIQWPHC
jgi:hypothetical protein